MTTPYPARKKNVIEVNGKTRRSFFLRRLRLVHAVASHCECVFLVTSGLLLVPVGIFTYRVIETT